MRLQFLQNIPFLSSASDARIAGEEVTARAAREVGSEVVGRAAGVMTGIPLFFTPFLTLLLFFPGLHSTACPERRRMEMRGKIIDESMKKKTSR